MWNKMYHLALKLEGQNCLVVGGGAVAERKVRALLDCAAAVTVISPELNEGLRELKAEGKLVYKQGRVKPGDLEGRLLVIAATDDQRLNARVAELCRKQGTLVNVVDNPELSTFFVPATVRRGPVCVSVSTGGASPLLARRIRTCLEQQITPELGELAVTLGEVRERMKQRYSSQARRQVEWERLLPEDVVEQLKAGKLESIRKRVNSCISSQSE